MTTKKVIYCSGPLFSPEDLRAMSEIAGVLEDSGFDTFLPQRDGLEAFIVNSIDSGCANSMLLRPVKLFANRAVFSLDTYQIVERCDGFVFNMNGRVPDEGGVVETAMAFSTGKPIVLYKNDSRSAFSGYDGSMVLGASYTHSVVDDIRRIPDALRRIEEKLCVFSESPFNRDHLPPRVMNAVRFGKRMWRFLKMIRFLRPQNKLLKNVAY